MKARLRIEQLEFTAELERHRPDPAKRKREIAAVVPIARELLERAGWGGVTPGDVRLIARQRGVIIDAARDRRLSYLGANVMRAAGGVPHPDLAKRKRPSPIKTSRNIHTVYVDRRLVEGTR